MARDGRSEHHVLGLSEPDDTGILDRQTRRIAAFLPAPGVSRLVPQVDLRSRQNHQAASEIQRWIHHDGEPRQRGQLHRAGWDADFGLQSGERWAWRLLPPISHGKIRHGFGPALSQEIRCDRRRARAALCAGNDRRRLCLLRRLVRVQDMGDVEIHLNDSRNARGEWREGCDLHDEF